MVNKRTKILDAAVACAEATGLATLTYQSVSAQCGMTTSHLQYYFSTVDVLKGCTIDRAIETRNLDVVAQAAVLGYDVPRGIAMDAINFIAERYA